MSEPTEIVRDKLVRKTQPEQQEIAYKEIKKQLQATLRENQDSGLIRLKENTSGVVPAVGPTITLQLWYSPLTRNAFLEYDLDMIAEGTYNTWRVKEVFEDKLRKYFHQNTLYMNIEILHPEDGYAEECDSGYLSLITPYSIGYWKSITGRYEFLEDRQYVLACANDIMNPSDQIDEGTPTRTFSQYCDEVNQIAQRYRQTSLTEAQKNAFIASAYQIANTYDRTSAAYTTAMNNLKNQYNIKTNIPEKVPQMWNEYKTLFTNWFGPDNFKHDPNVEKWTKYLTVIDPPKPKQTFVIESFSNNSNNNDDIIDEDELNSYA